MSTQTAAILLAGLGFGDEGKGTMVDYLVRKHKAVAVVRYNGGPQAAHNVMTAEGRHHTFAQFGSGSFMSGVQTFLSRFTLVNPGSFLNEADHLRVIGVPVQGRVIVDKQAVVVTPFHGAANRLRELARKKNRHGSCGVGVGEAYTDAQNPDSDVLRVGDLLQPGIAAEKLQTLRAKKLLQLQPVIDAIPAHILRDRELHLLTSNTVFRRCLDEYAEFAEMVVIQDSSFLASLLAKGPVIFEGAQGVLLDPVHGFPPHVTKTDITFANAELLLNEAGYGGERKRVGVMRTYATRHGAGPLPTEDAALAAALPEVHNGTDFWQQHFRVGHFDLVLTKQALRAIGGVDELMLTHMDRIAAMPELKIRVSGQAENVVYEKISPKEGEAFVTYLQERLQTPITTLSFGPTAEHKREFNYGAPTKSMIFGA